MEELPEEAKKNKEIFRMYEACKVATEIIKKASIDLVTLPSVSSSIMNNG